jgi:hypothetical protein
MYLLETTEPTNKPTIVQVQIVGKMDFLTNHIMESLTRESLKELSLQELTRQQKQCEK